MGAAVPVSVVAAGRGARRVVVSGSRSGACAPGFLPLLLGARARVSVGCARGVDQAVRSAVPSARVRVFHAVAFGSGRGAFALRSAALVRSVAGARSALFVCFPGRACPVGLVPSASARSCFCGLGSGSWASLALAVGLGVPALVWLPVGVAVPVGWGLRGLGGGWWAV